MLTIQEVGLSIFSDAPKNFYILGGSEYGIKDKYLDILVSKIGAKLEYDSVASVINLMTKYHIIPLQPQVYVVRYDKEFVSQLSKELADQVLSLNIIGTLVLIYEDSKDITKLNKMFPDNTASIDPIDIKHRVKYLRADFPELNENVITCVAKHTTDYFQAKNICRSLYVVKDKYLFSEKQILTLFNLQLSYTNDDIQLAIASRNFNALTYISEHYDGDLQNILYQILRVMIELDKVQSTKYSKSPLKEYSKKWSPADIYYMFNHTYNAIKSLRSGYTVELPDLIIYLASLMKFQQIPDTRILA